MEILTLMLSNNIWWTRQARIRTERRLLSNASQSQIILFWYSFYSVAVSIYYIGEPQNLLVSKSWLIYSILILAISSFMNGFTYKERANLIKENYLELWTLYSEARRLETNGQPTVSLEKEYIASMQKCENHLPKDYIEALYDNYINSIDKTNISPNPTDKQIFQAKLYRALRLGTLTFLYIFPVAISVFMVNGTKFYNMVMSFL